MRGTHTIRRQVLEVELSGSESEGLAFQQRLPDLCRDVLGPALERVFDRLVPSTEHWVFDRLEIDAGNFRPQDLDGAFVDAVTRWLERHLRETPRVASPAVAR